jgi:hypothetical protein
MGAHLRRQNIVDRRPWPLGQPGYSSKKSGPDSQTEVGSDGAIGVYEGNDSEGARTREDRAGYQQTDEARQNPVGWTRALSALLGVANSQKADLLGELGSSSLAPWMSGAAKQCWRVGSKTAVKVRLK